MDWNILFQIIRLAYNVLWILAKGFGTKDDFVADKLKSPKRGKYMPDK